MVNIVGASCFELAVSHCSTTELPVNYIKLYQTLHLANETGAAELSLLLPA